MPDAPRIPGLLDDERDALIACFAQMNSASQHNALRTDYYELDSVLQRISNVIPQQYYQAARTLGWCARAVDKVAERSTIEGFAWPDGELDGLGWTDVERENFARTEFGSGILSSLLHGVSWMVVSQSAMDGDPDVMIHTVDALSASGVWNGRARRLDSFVQVTERNKEQAPAELTIFLPGRITRCRKDAGRWSVDRSDHDYGMPVEPIVYRPRPPRRPYGYSRITRSAMGIQDRALRTLVRLEGMSDIYSFAEQIILGADPSAFVSDSASNPWARVMGRWKGLPDDAEAQSDNLARAQVMQLDAQSPTPHLDAFKLHAGIFSGETGIPITELGVIAEANSSTQDASENSQQALIDTADIAKDSWTPQIQRTMTTALAMKNGVSVDAVPNEWRSIQPVFRDSRFVSRSAAADAGLKLVQAVPWLAETSVGLSKLGLSQQEIDLAMADRRRAAGRMAAQSIGAAAAAAPAVQPEQQPGASGLDEAQELKAKFDALGVAVRAGVDPSEAASRLGLSGIRFTGAIPASLRIPDGMAEKLED